MARVIKRGKVWQYEISYKTEDGKYAKERKSGFRTKSEAQAAAAEMEYEMGKGFDPSQKNMLLSDYFERWVKIYKKHLITEVTYSKYYNSLNMTKRLFPETTLGSLTREEYQLALNKYAETHAKTTVYTLHSHLKQCLSDAFNERIILKNVVANINITGNRDCEKKIEEKYLNVTDLKRLVEACEKKLDPRFPSPYMIILSAVTGMRFAEVAGLTWDDIDFDNQTISVNKTWDYKVTMNFAPTKTKSSIRTVDIDERTVEIFKKYQKDQQELFSERNIANPLNLIFYNHVEGVITPNGVNKMLRYLQNKLDIDNQITFHGLRHSHASMLLYEGVDIFLVSDRLGHKDVSITQKVYSHVLEEMREKHRPIISNKVKNIYNY